MIPILYEKDETVFTSNGLGRLRDCISCVVTEERNGIYECDFEYPIDGVNYDRIQCGRIIAVEHDESNDVQPFDIVGYSRPINGVVTFHAVHISYRQTALTASGTNIQSLADAFTMLGNAQPSNPFNYWSDKGSVGYLASGDGVPHSVRSILGGMEGSILDAYGGEYEWDKWTVKLWASRGSLKNFAIRYGVNLTDYEEDLDYSDTYNSVVPYWVGQGDDGNDVIITGDRQTVNYPTFNGQGRCIPLDVTDKFDSDQGEPTQAQVEAEGLAYINANQPYLPSQTIKVDFVRLSDSPEYAQFASLQKCKLCDSVNVIFPQYKMQGQFKIVKTEYDVLQEKYISLELGTLSVTLSEALGINADSSNTFRSGGNSGVPTGGTTGQVLAKASNDDYDTSWVNQFNTTVISPSGQVANSSVMEFSRNNSKCYQVGSYYIVFCDVVIKFTQNRNARNPMFRLLYDGKALTPVATSMITGQTENSTTTFDPVYHTNGWWYNPVAMSSGNKYVYAQGAYLAELSSI